MRTQDIALLGLDSDKRIVWQSTDSTLLPPDLRGRLLADVFPELSAELEAQQYVAIPRSEKLAPMRALAMHVQVTEYDWLLRFEAVSESKDQEALQEARDVALKLISAGYEARAALTEELHQGVQQILAALLIRLSGMGESPSADDLATIRELVNKALDSIRVVTKTLVPAAHSRGLAEALSELGEILGKHAGLRLVGPCGEHARYARPIEIVAYDAIRILLTTLAQEGLSEVSLSLHDVPDALRVILELYDFKKSVAAVESRIRNKCLVHVQGSIAVETDSDCTTVVIVIPKRTHND